MIRIRFHGRGGHGVKTASRIVGAAAFTAGYHAQDSPIYGAERRGAAVVAFTRISSQPILERGVITEPDLIVIGDDTLLSDSGAGVLVGQEAARAVLINAVETAALVEEFRIEPEVHGLDITDRTLSKLGKASALSVGLAAAAARLIGVVTEDVLLQATREELEHAGLDDRRLAANLALAGEIFQALKPMADVASRPRQARERDSVYAVPHQDSVLATPSILASGNSAERQTGKWRVERPEIDYGICTRCGICFVRCPDAAISLNEDGYPVIDYEHCKGCMECWDQCPVEGAIRKEKEVRAW